MSLLRASDLATAPRALTMERTSWGFIERCAENPGFFEGNRLVLDAAPSRPDIPRWIDRYFEIFPARVGLYPAVIVWYDEYTSGPLAFDGLVDHAGLARMGPYSKTELEVEASLVSPSDDAFWPQLESLEAKVYPGLDDFNKWRVRTLRELVYAGRGEYFGISKNGHLVAAAGAFMGLGAVRFSSVVTSPEYRRRGYASYLINLLSARGGQSKYPVVIVAEKGSLAERLYGSLGFEPFILVRLLSVNVRVKDRNSGR